jgi:hypothetical protein
MVSSNRGSCQGQRSGKKGQTPFSPWCRTSAVGWDRVSRQEYYEEGLRKGGRGKAGGTALVWHALD